MHLLISWLQSPSTMILEPKKIKSISVSTFFPSTCHEVMGPDAMILVFWMLSFKPAFYTLPKRFFSSTSLFRVVSSAYLRLLIFLPTILIPACASSSLAICMMYSAYKLITRLTIYSLDILLSQFGPSLLFHVQFLLLLLDLNTGFSGGRYGNIIQVWYAHLSKSFSPFVVIHKGFCIVNETEDVFLEFPWFFYDSTDVGTLISVPLSFLIQTVHLEFHSSHTVRA